jgi:pyruvate formate lyase activating enzyme
MSNTAPTGNVLNIQRYCSHDGPGIRTTVFLKGCSLRCKWCSNPESISPKVELAYDKSLCKGAKECGKCLQAPFPEGGFYVVDGPDDKISVNWDLAMECDEETISLCPTDALYTFGKEMTADQVLDEVERDASFYRTSGGGMTLSGGEAVMQPDFCAALLEGAHERGIHTAIETAANLPWRFYEQVLPHVDLVLHDLKLMDSARHKKWTGVSNERLLDNFRKAYEAFPKTEFIARRPLIPGVNDDEADIRAALEFIMPYSNVSEFELLPYMRFGMGKYELLGEIYELKDFAPPSEESLERLRAIIAEAFKSREAART